jgi:hypothetical protein
MPAAILTPVARVVPLAFVAILLSAGAAPAAEQRPPARPSTQPSDTAGALVQWLVTEAPWQGEQTVVVQNPAWTRVSRFQPKTVKSAYLGIGVDKPDPTLRAQLKLPEGAGLVVNFVEEAGPSKDAVRVHDVLQKLDDQVLINGDQLVTLVRMRKPGDTLRLTVIREAAPVTVEVKLAEKDLPPLQSYLGRGAGDAPAGEQPAPAGAQDAYAALANTYTNNVTNDYARFVATAVTTGPMTFDDGEHVLQIRLQGGVGRLVVIEKTTGSKLFEGPIGSEEQWKAVPEGVRRKLEGLGQLNMFTPTVGFSDAGTVEFTNTLVAPTTRPANKPAGSK